MLGRGRRERGGREKGEGRREKGEGRREKGERRKEKGEGGREKGEGRRENGGREKGEGEKEQGELPTFQHFFILRIKFRAVLFRIFFTKGIHVEVFVVKLAFKKSPIVLFIDGL
jgi:hypothetical protein